MKSNKLQTTLLVILMSLSTMLSAEIVRDGTLGNKGALVGPHFLIEETMGQQFGSNLFHSFESFSINAGESATFMGSDSVAHIISRVTGNEVSFINGLLRSEVPDANLYFLNPNGFIFGEQATLDIQGGFHLSTADTLYLGEGGRFDVSTPNQSLLNVAPPTHFGFLSNQPGEVTIQGSFLQVLPEKTLSITGGDLHIQEGTLYAPDGQINLVSVVAAGDIVPGLSNTKALGTVTLSQSPDIPLKKIDDIDIANIDTSGVTGGNVFIQSGKFFLSGGSISSQVIDGIRQKSVSRITIETQELRLQDNSSIDTNTFGDGDGGNITITATDNLTLINSGISVAAGLETTGNAGNIQLQVGQLTLQDGGFLNSGTLGSGIGGDILINATQGVSLFNRSLIASSVGAPFTLSLGSGGNIGIIAPHIEIEGRSEVQSGTFDITRGNGGNISIETEQLTLNDSGSITAFTMGNGVGGNIDIVSRELKMHNGLITSESVGRGNAGSITFTTDKALLNHLSVIYASATQAGGGNIEFKVDDNLYLFNSGITTRAEGEQTQHSGGNLTISKPQFLVLDKSQLNASAYAGNGGNIKIIADHFIKSIGSLIDASSELGIDGNIEIISLDEDITDNFTILSDSFFDASKFLPKRCVERLGTDISSFYVTGPKILTEAPHNLSVHIPTRLLTTLSDNRVLGSNPFSVEPQFIKNSVH
ncbi:filamentous hemagglutinin N-terminal domain-containing protein [Candidatus Parabeggiatoa sp. HSG14]|uniref:two-partner secretion domain-containing protein n=1 Tax=Candidatus Parabeggiatoa sp. HSG14 TaxID=3055593 RepID=UPI0025A86C28|nr:filamentous hemagglutinin N-terminal domain-containing protein [Thiotrichales bacterium HSG14]